MRHAGWAFFLAAGLASAQEQALFNGTSLAGWTKMHGGEYSVQAGAIVLEKGNGWLRTDAEFDDFDLTVEWRADAQYAGGKLYDSGLFFRTKAEGKPWPPGKYQMNMKHGSGGELSGLVKDGKPELLKPPGEWNVYRLKCVGAKAEAWINGQPAWSTDKIKTPKGHLGFQAEGFRIEVRKVVLKPAS